MARGLARAEEEAGEVDRQNLFPGGERQLLRRCAPDDAGIVDQDVEPAIAPRDGGKPFDDRRLVGDIEDLNRGLGAVRAQLLHHRLGGRGIDVVDGDRRPRRTKPERTGAAKATARPRHQRHLAVEAKGGIDRRAARASLGSHLPPAHLEG